MNHRGYVPWLLWVRPTNVGERVWLLMRPGICVDDLDTRTSQIAAACWARDARVRAWRRLVAVVLVDVVRRDPLTSGKLVGSPLTGLAGGNAPIALPGIPVDISSVMATSLTRLAGSAPGSVPTMASRTGSSAPTPPSGAVLAGSAHAATLRATRGSHVHRQASSAGVPVAAEPVLRPKGPGAVSSSGEDVSDSSVVPRLSS